MGTLRRSKYYGRLRKTPSYSIYCNLRVWLYWKAWNYCERPVRATSTTRREEEAEHYKSAMHPTGHLSGGRARAGKMKEESRPIRESENSSTLRNAISNTQRPPPRNMINLEEELKESAYEQSNSGKKDDHKQTMTFEPVRGRKFRWWPGRSKMLLVTCLLWLELPVGLLHFAFERRAEHEGVSLLVSHYACCLLHVDDCFSFCYIITYRCCPSRTNRHKSQMLD